MSSRAQVIRFLFVLIGIGGVAIAASQRNTLAAVLLAVSIAFLSAVRLGPARH